jgi:hypothetical protein
MCVKHQAQQRYSQEQQYKTYLPSGILVISVNSVILFIPVIRFSFRLG